MTMARSLLYAALILLAATLPAKADQITLHRVTLEDAETTIAEALIANGAGERIEVRVNGRPEGTLVSHSSPVTATVGELAFDESTHSWNATLYFEAEERPLAPLKLSGRYDELLQIPVLVHRMAAGETITEPDITWKVVAASRLRKNTVLEAAQLIGKSPVRTISPDRYIREEELKAPPVIDKGDTVTMRYRKGVLEIATVGEALDGGASGDTIRIRNNDSRIVVHAIVTGPGEARVQGTSSHSERSRNFSRR